MTDKKYLSTDRLRESRQRRYSAKQQFESDRGRVLFSAPMRRLQRKAQVFSLESNAAVRSRLTHSIEVAHVGRYISQQLRRVAESANNNEITLECERIEPLVETACLLHDIGNPPFGHLGEKAIQEWFKSKSEEIYGKSTGKELDEENQYFLDFCNFDGNPQGLRIVLNLQGFPEKKGLNLTIAQIGTLVKYPRFSGEANPAYSKIGVFSSEARDIKNVWKKLGIPWGTRHPLVYLMEAADDIAYSLSDIEDGIEKSIINEDDVLSYLENKFCDFRTEQLRDAIPGELSKNSVVGRFVGFRTNMINMLTQHAAEIYYQHYTQGTLCDLKEIFSKDMHDEYAIALNHINNYCRDTLYKSAEAEDIEIAGYNIVYGLLDKFSPLLKLPRVEFNQLVHNRKGNDLCRRMFAKLPQSLVDHYVISVKESWNEEWFIRFQLIVDFISGMTDDYALKAYKLFHGIEVEIL